MGLPSRALMDFGKLLLCAFSIIKRDRVNNEAFLNYRGKRSGISDQRLAELETLLALQKFRDQQMRTRVPVAYGVFDPDRM